MTDVKAVEKILKTHGWSTPFEVLVKLASDGKARSGSSVTARMRDLRKSAYGGFVVKRRRRKGTKTTFEYAISGRKCR